MQIEDASLNKARWLVFALIPLVIGVYALLEARPWQATEVTTGCVTGYERVIHPNAHNMADSYFRVGGVEFHLTRSAWAPGFKDDASIQNRESVSVSHRGAHVIAVRPHTGSC